MKNWHFILLLCLAAAACKKGDKKPTCGCDSEPTGTEDDRPGTLETGSAIIHTQYGTYLNGMPTFILQNLTVCNPEALDSLDRGDGNYLEVIFTAQYHKSCEQDVPGQPEERPITITKIRVAPPRQ